MPGGRPPKPTALKMLAGTLRPSRTNFAEAKPPAAAPDIAPPDFLSAEAVAVWREVVPLLSAQGLLTKADVLALVALCSAAGDFRRAERATKRSMMRRTPNGYRQPNEWYSVKKQAREALFVALREFGMTPSSRTKVQAAAPTEPEDALDKLRSLKA